MAAKITMKRRFTTEIRRFLWNALMVAVLFLPVFILAGAIEEWLRSGWPKVDLHRDLDGALVLYIIMIGPLLLASLVYSAAFYFVPSRWKTASPRAIGVMLASLLPVTVVVLQLPGDAFLVVKYLQTIIAITIYGMCTGVYRTAQDKTAP